MRPRASGSSTTPGSASRFSCGRRSSWECSWSGLVGVTIFAVHARRQAKFSQAEAEKQARIASDNQTEAEKQARIAAVNQTKAEAKEAEAQESEARSRQMTVSIF